MKVFLPVILAIGFFLTRANASESAHLSQNDIALLPLDILESSVMLSYTDDLVYKMDARNFVTASKEILNYPLEKILNKISEAYTAFRTSVVEALSKILKIDVGVWLERFEKALAYCSRARKHDIVEGAKLILKDGLGCIQTDSQKLLEMKTRGFEASQILQETWPKFRSQLENCKKVHTKINEVNIAEENEEPLDSQSLLGDRFDEIKCIARTIQETASNLKPVPGHLYALGKMLLNISFSSKEEITKCIAKTVRTQIPVLQKTAKTMAACVAFTI